VTATDVAPVVLQLSVEVEPAATLAGLAVKLLITGFVAGGAGVGVGVTAGVGGTGVTGIGVGATGVIGTGVGAGVET
jgi:hypothetical protein